MNFKVLLEKINDVTRAKPLIYFTRDAERGIGLEHLLTSYHICCIEDSQLVRDMQSSGISVFCLEQEVGRVVDKSTQSLVQHKATQVWLKTIASGGFYATTLYPHKTFSYEIKKLDGTVLMNDTQVTRLFEDKVLAASVFKAASIQTPTLSTSEITKDFFSPDAFIAEKYVFQLAKGHTGTSTFFITTFADFSEFIAKYEGSTVRVMRMVQGNTYTLNGIVLPETIAVGPLQLQVTGISPLTDRQGVTVGNNFSLAQEQVSALTQEAIAAQVKTIGEALRSKGFKGLFGVDVIVDQYNQVWVIEVNARQTANVSFQTQLELLHGDEVIPQLLFHYAAWLSIDTAQLASYEAPQLSGSQIFMRATENHSALMHNIDNGFYRLRSDTVARDTLEKESGAVIYIDEEKDKPLIFESGGYRLGQEKSGGMLLLSRDEEISVSPTDELLRIQSTDSLLLSDGSIKPWLREFFSELRK